MQTVWKENSTKDIKTAQLLISAGFAASQIAVLYFMIWDTLTPIHSPSPPRNSSAATPSWILSRSLAQFETDSLE